MRQYMADEVAMGLRITCPNEAISEPPRVMLELICDGDHGLLPVPVECFIHECGAIEQYAAAMRAGWKEHSNSHGRLFFCPQCSSKTPRT